MTPVIIIWLTAFSFLRTIPESATVVVSNGLPEHVITSAFYLPSSGTIPVTFRFQDGIQPGGTACLDLPWGMHQFIGFESDLGGVFIKHGYFVSSSQDTLPVGLADKEYGGVLHRVRGSAPLTIRNSSSAPLASVEIAFDSLPPLQLVGKNPLMPGEVIRAWIDPVPECHLFFRDQLGTMTPPLEAEPGLDTVYACTNELFLSTEGIEARENSVSISNCMPGVSIVQIEVFDQWGGVLASLDLSPSPLRTWGTLSISVSGTPSSAVCTDEFGRVYSADIENGRCIIDLWALDFGFDFPGGV